MDDATLEQLLYSSKEPLMPLKQYILIYKATSNNSWFHSDTQHSW